MFFSLNLLGVAYFLKTNVVFSISNAYWSSAMPFQLILRGEQYHVCHESSLSASNMDLQVLILKRNGSDRPLEPDIPGRLSQMDPTK